MRITSVSKLVAAGNVVIRDTFKAEADKSETTPEQKQLYRKSTAQQQDYIKLDGNSLTVRLPVTREDYEHSTKGSGDMEKQAEEFKKADINGDIIVCREALVDKGNNRNLDADQRIRQRRQAIKSR